MVDEAVDRSERHCGVGENPVPFAEGLIGGDHDGTPLVTGGDELEEHARLGLVLGNVGQVVEDEQIELVELVDGGFQLQLASRDLKLLDEIGGAGVSVKCSCMSTAVS